MRTLGLSPKAVLAFLFPLISAAVGAGISWAIGGFGHFDTTSIVIAATGVAASGLALLGAYVGKPGNVVPVDGKAPTYFGAGSTPEATVNVSTHLDGKTIAQAMIDFERKHGAKSKSSAPEMAAASEPPAPFDADGEPTTGIGDFANYPLESFVADPSDTHGASDAAEAVAA